MDKELPLGANDLWIRHGIGAGTRFSAKISKLDDEPKIATLPFVESPGAIKEWGPVQELANCHIVVTLSSNSGQIVAI
jgi:hypothetical protein